MVLGKYIVC